MTEEVRKLHGLMLPWVHDLLPKITATPTTIRGNRVFLLAFATGRRCSQLYNCLQGKQPLAPIPPAPEGACHASYQGFTSVAKAISAIREMTNGSDLGIEVPPVADNAIAFIGLGHESSTVMVAAPLPGGKYMLDPTQGTGKTHTTGFGLN